MLKGKHSLRCLIATALFYPGINLACYLYLNVYFELEQSSNLITLQAFAQLLFIILLIHTPLVLIGGYAGMRQKSIKNPCKANLMSRSVPQQPFYNSYYFSMFVGGILPFGAVLIELSFVMTSLWKHSFNYLFLFLHISFIILILTCA